MQTSKLIIASLWLLLLATTQVTQTTRAANSKRGEQDKSSQGARGVPPNSPEGDNKGGQRTKVALHPDGSTQAPVRLARRRANATTQQTRAKDNHQATSGEQDDKLALQFIQVDPSVQSNLRQQQQKERHQQHQNQQKPSQKASSGSSLQSWHTMGSSQPALASNKQAANLESLNRFLLDQQDSATASAAADDDESRQERFEDQPSGATYDRQLQQPKRTKYPLPKAMKQSSSTQSPSSLVTSISTSTYSQVDHLSRLYLDSTMPLEVRAHLGETAYLSCRLRANLQQSEQLQVSWVRNMQILTSGEFRYTSDERFRASHPGGSNDWPLEIHNVRASDEGDYECQVNSEPKPASATVHLQVIATQVEILEAPYVRVDEDAQIELTCRVQFNSQAELAGASRAQLDSEDPTGELSDVYQSSGLDETPAHNSGGEREFELAANKPAKVMTNWHAARLRRRERSPPRTNTAIAANRQQSFWPYWYKDNVSIQYNNPRGNVQVEQRDLTGGGIESVLRLSGARRADNGTYVCKLVPALNEVQPAQAQVLVVPSGTPSLVPKPNEHLLVCQLLLVSLLVIQINRLLVAGTL